MYIPETLWHHWRKSCHHRKWSTAVAAAVVGGGGVGCIVVVGSYWLVLPSFIGETKQPKLENSKKEKNQGLNPNIWLCRYINRYHKDETRGKKKKSWEDKERKEERIREALLLTWVGGGPNRKEGKGVVLSCNSFSSSLYLWD